ncbi:hypothetical protein ACFVFJ_47750 [Streptomyces sp. NPDC057717]|uniref:hypothetical protein n=1 Tax=Streptomyces sp. NPDC057717 TaxID=3346224 RepID=UPI00368D9E43
MTDLAFTNERGQIEHRLLLDGYLRDVEEDVGWNAEFPRYVWLLRRLGFPAAIPRFQFTGIEPL